MRPASQQRPRGPQRHGQLTAVFSLDSAFYALGCLGLYGQGPTPSKSRDQLHCPGCPDTGRGTKTHPSLPQDFCTHKLSSSGQDEDTVLLNTDPPWMLPGVPRMGPLTDGPGGPAGSECPGERLYPQMGSGLDFDLYVFLSLQRFTMSLGRLLCLKGVGLARERGCTVLGKSPLSQR